MPTPPLSDDSLRAAVEAVRTHGSVSRAAAATGRRRSTLQSQITEARERWPDCLPPASYARNSNWAAPDDWQRDAPAFEYPDIPSGEPTYEELKAQAIADFERLHTHKEAAKLIRIKVNLDGPYGILTMGDPHIDAAGTDWPLLEKHTRLIRNTPGLFGANVGDITNNWIGRLARLYGEQNMSRKRALILAEGWLREVRWLWIDPGNHDLWSGADDPVRWITRFAGIHYKWQGSRLDLVSPNGASVIINSRHDHPGHSMYHPTHGPLKASIWDGFHDDVYTCGHIHSGAYMLKPHPNGKYSHILRLSAYKVYDSHKDEKGFLDSHLPAGMFIVNPHAQEQRNRVSFHHDVDEGAAILTDMRRRHASGKTVRTERAA